MGSLLYCFLLDFLQVENILSVLLDGFDSTVHLVVVTATPPHFGFHEKHQNLMHLTRADMFIGGHLH